MDDMSHNDPSNADIMSVLLRLTAKVDQIDARTERTDARLTRVEDRLTSLENRLTYVERSVETLTDIVRDLHSAFRLHVNDPYAHTR